MHSHKHFYRGKAIRIYYPECAPAALVIQNGKGKRHIVICGLSGSTVHFTDYLVNVTMFIKKLLIIKCALWVCLKHLSVTFLILRRNERV